MTRAESRTAPLWAGVLGPWAFIASWIVAGTMTEGYDPVSHAVSRLAALDVHHRWIVTSGMTIFGLSAVVFGARMRTRLGRRAGTMLVLAGITSLGVAAFPCSEGCPGMGASFTDTGHIIMAALHYATFTAVPFVAARSEGSFVLPARWLAAVAAASLLAQAAGVGPNGLMQRLGLTLNDIWMIGMAFAAMREIRRHPDPLVTS